MGLSIKLSENGGAAPEAVPYMPAGESVIDASVNGAPGRRRVVATREACERLQRDLEEHLEASEARQKARPLLMFDHKTDGGAAAVPLGFEWDEERGILLRVEWTQAGREAVEGGNYGYISPSFRLQRGTGEILGLAGGVEVGSLVNDPAFENNECIAASKEDVPEVVVVHAANPYGCNQYGHEWSGKHGDDWGGTVEEEVSLDSVKERKFSLNQKIQKMSDEIVKLAKLGSAEKDIEKRKEINKKLEELGKTKKKQVEEYQKLNMKETELKDRERYEKSKQSFVKAAREDVLPPHENQADFVEVVQNIGVSGEGVGVENRNNNKKNMEEVAKLLGLPADADAAEICAKIAALQKESGDVKKRIEEVEAEKEEHKKALHKHKEEAAMAFAERQKKEGKIAPHDKERLEAARALYLTDSANAELIFAGMKRVDNVREDGKVDVADQVQAAAAKNYENLSLAELLAAEE